MLARVLFYQFNRKLKSCIWGFLMSVFLYFCLIILVTNTKGNWKKNFIASPFFYPRAGNFCEYTSTAVKEKLSRIHWEYLYYYRDQSTFPWKSIVWCKVPKAGSTSLTRLFLELAGAQDIINSTKIHQKLRTFYPKFSEHVMTKRMRMSFKFVVVRDPFERILSAYRDKLENYQRDLIYRDGYYYNTFGKYMLHTPVQNSTIREPSWKEFVDYLIKTPVEKYDEHWAPIAYLCSPCSVHFDAIIKMENFGQGIQHPLSQARIKSPVEWAHKTGTSNQEILRNYFKNLTNKDVQKLYEIYKADFTLFGYSPTKYFNLIKDS